MISGAWNKERFNGEYIAFIHQFIMATFCHTFKNKDNSSDFHRFLLSFKKSKSSLFKNCFPNMRKIYGTYTSYLFVSFHLLSEKSRV